MAESFIHVFGLAFHVCMRIMVSPLHMSTHTHINMYNIHVRVCARYMSLDSLSLSLYIYTYMEKSHTHIYIYRTNPGNINMYSTDIGLWKLMEIVKNTR